MTAKKHTFDIGTLSSAIDKIIVQGSKVFINFSGQEKTYEFTWKPANRILLEKLNTFIESPEKVSLGRFYNESLRNGDLVTVQYQYTLTTKGIKNGQNVQNWQKVCFFTKKEKLDRNGGIGRKWTI